MKTPNLLEVPKTAPSRKEKLEAFKKQHGIETYRTPGYTPADHPWFAIHVPKAREAGKDYGLTRKSTWIECEAKIGSYLEDASITATGETELVAVRTLCSNLEIPCPL